MISFLIFFCVCFNQNMIIVVPVILLSFKDKIYDEHLIKLISILLTIIVMPGALCPSNLG